MIHTNLTQGAVMKSLDDIEARWTRVLDKITKRNLAKHKLTDTHLTRAALEAAAEVGK